ncbi:MAG: hypothetical protein OXF72_01850, partial [Gammaproteobacteria bacterium]|nr:hypothetical protein [Gammaproteobacteria bacterium]
VSGSNAHLLSGELSTLLTGRHIKVELFPFDVAGYRTLRSKASTSEYLKRGGFPEPATSEDGEGRAKWILSFMENTARCPFK